MSILDLLRKPAETSAALREKLAEIEGQIPALRALADAADVERSRGLLTLTDREIEVIEARLARARRDLDRARAAREELDRQVAETARREADAVLGTIVSSADARAEAIARRLHRDYARHAAALVELLNEAIAADRQVIEARDALRSAGRPPDAIKLVEERAAIGTATGLRVSLVAETSLVPVANVPGYGSARLQAARLGVGQA